MDDALPRVRGQLPDGAPWRIGIVGVGSVGSQIADQLVRNGIRDIVLIDRDDVNAPNLSRSVYRPPDVGRPKVFALAEHLQAIGGPRLRVSAIRDDVRGVLDTAGVLTDRDLLVLTTDNPGAELQVNLHVIAPASAWSRPSCIGPPRRARWPGSRRIADRPACAV